MIFHIWCIIKAWFGTEIGTGTKAAHPLLVLFASFQVALSSYDWLCEMLMAEFTAAFFSL